MNKKSYVAKKRWWPKFLNLYYFLVTIKHLLWIIFRFLGLTIFTPKRNVVVNAQSIFVPFKNVSFMPGYLNMLIWGIFDGVVVNVVVVVFVVDTLQLVF